METFEENLNAIEQNEKCTLSLHIRRFQEL